MTDNYDVAMHDMVQLLESVHHTVAEGAIELADAFVNEDKVGGDALQRKIGEAQRKSDGDEEALAA